MANQVTRTISKALNPEKEVYNILTFDTHERYQQQLCKTGHNFYSFRYDGCKEWDESYGERPENYYILPKNAVISGIDLDFILSQSKFGQFQVVSQLNNYFKLPVISLEHTLPMSNWPNSQLETFRKMVGDLNVFISRYSINEWSVDSPSCFVVHHSVDTEMFHPDKKNTSPKMPRVLSVVNDFINRDYCCNYSGWKRITDQLEYVKIIGKTEGLSEPATSIESLATEYANSQVFLNTSTVSPVPTSLLEAMACECAVVTTATCMIPEIIEQGVNGFMSNDEDELRDYCKKLQEDPVLAEKIGKNARRTIIAKFSETDFINNWNNIFNMAYGRKQ